MIAVNQIIIVSSISSLTLNRPTFPYCSTKRFITITLGYERLSVYFIGLELFLDTSVKLIMLAVQQMVKNYYLMGIKHWKLLFGSKESRITFLIGLANAVVQNC